MAGSYPDVPSRRMAIDEDGTIGGHRNAIDTSPFSEWSAAQMIEVNDEDLANGPTVAGGSAGSHYAFLIFPEIREIDGVHANHNVSNHLQNLHVSQDTTSTWDGTWTLLTSDLSDPRTLDSWRTSILSLAESNIRGVRLSMPNSGSAQRIDRWHVYGEITPGETPNRLLFFNGVTDLEFGLPIDYGNIPRGSAEDRTFYLRNNSGSLTASTVQITAESLYLSSGDWFTFDEGSGFQSTLPLASSIGPGADSPSITLRRVTPDSEGLGLHAARIQASVGSWA